MLEIRVKNKQQSAVIKMEQEGEELKRGAINKALSFLDTYQGERTVSAPKITIQEKPKKPVKTNKGPLEEETKENQVDPLDDMIEKTFRPRNRQLPLIRPSESPAHRDENDCRAKINCPSCDTESHRYVKFGFRYTFCPGCNEKLHLKSATGKWGEEDDDGNVYLAFEEYQEVSERH
ncbi:hypothetical protein [Sediminibacillus terrae]|uniref:hypothetical protein n=1 Tax=Sediminibacillus terrae TaxID=1562106 RepID=UPI001295B763|nr:hypothetical protein [Sediminibacillus terrae]